MRFKIDENLPAEIAEILRSAGYDALTVQDEALKGEADSRVMEVCRQENRILVTIDIDFADIRSYPPRLFPGIMVLRMSRQSKRQVIQVFQKTLPYLQREPMEHRLWIVEESRIRIHGDGEREAGKRPEEGS